jgi:hypothetical protein
VEQLNLPCSISPEKFMNFRNSLLFVFITFNLLSAAALGTVPIKGNSAHGIGNGSDNWNVTENFLDVSTISLKYNTLFSGSQQSAQVYSVGDGVYEQLGCTSGSSCNVGDETPVDFMFQVPVSQIQNGMVTFTNFTGAISTLEVESCDGPAKLGSGNGPGFLCTTYPNGTGNLSVNACLTGTNGSSLTFTLSGSLTSLGSVTFLMQYPNTTGTVSGPTLASTPQSASGSIG